MQFPDYERCGVNIAASILKEFGLESSHRTLRELDMALSRRSYRNIIVMLFDGMGMDAIGKHAPKDGFLRSRRTNVLSAVFPSTTAAATTSLISGLEPGEHGWVGWTLHFSDIGKSVDVFPNHIQFTKQRAAESSVAMAHFPYIQVTERVSQSGRGKGQSVSPFHGVIADSLEKLFSETEKLMHETGRHYIYAYWPEPDHSMHLHGCASAKITRVMAEIDERLKGFSERLSPEDLVIVTADHGLIDGIPEFFEDYPKLEMMLRLAPCVEPRAAALYVKKECIEAFPQAFKEAFGDHYLLYTQKEALKSGLFGINAYRSELPSLIGDFFAVSTGPHALYLKREHCGLIGMHAGLTEQEMNVPMILLQSPEQD